MDYSNQKMGGFSMIELIIVLVIISTLTMLSYPLLSKITPGRASSGAADIIRTDFNYAKGKAISEGNDFVIVFNNPAVNQYTLYDDNDSNWATPLDNDLIKTVTLPNGIIFGRSNNLIKRTTCANTVDPDGLHLDPTNKITFSPQGSSNAVSIYIIPANDDANNAQISDNMRAISTSIIGRVKTWRYNKETLCWN